MPEEENRTPIEQESTISLPNKEEMLERLRTVDTDQNLVEKFYPPLLKEAGNEFNGMGVSVIILGSVRDYIQALYKGQKDMTSLEAQAFISNRVPKFIEALISDLDVATKAKAEISEALPHIVALFPLKGKK